MLRTIEFKGLAYVYISLARTQLKCLNYIFYEIVHRRHFVYKKYHALLSFTI